MPIGFPEYIAEELKTRLTRFIPLLTLILIIYTGQLWYLQVYKGKYYREKSIKYRIRHERVIPARGLILDRAGNVLVENRPMYNIELYPEDCPDPNLVLHRLERLLRDAGMESLLQHKLDTVPTHKKRVTVLRDVDFACISLVEAHKLELPGMGTTYRAKRYYPYGNVAAHVFGYMGKISSSEWNILKKDRDKRYQSDDMIGKNGLEQVFEQELTGFPATVTYETDALGNKLEMLTPPELRRAVPGKSLILTLDWSMQQYIKEIFKDFTGAVVVMNPKNGDVLALVSNPSYDPNLFTLGIEQKKWKALIENPLHPLFNRSLQAAYSPGSIFKIITAIAALQAHRVTTSTTFTCKGWGKFYGDIRYCWKRGGHGVMNVHNAIVHSCNIFFFNTALELPIEKIAAVAQRFGLSQKTGISLPHEEKGVIPSPEWKEKVLHKPWFKGETLSVAIGQGSVLVTPIQLAAMVSAVANGGTLYRPRLVLKVGEQVRPVKIRRKLTLSPAILATIRNALKGVVNEKGGTAYAIHDESLIVAGKTGTTQVVTRELAKKYKKGQLPHKYWDHNWFAAYAPFDDPALTVVVFIEHGGKQGTRHKLRIARKIFNRFLIHQQKKKTAQDKDLTPSTRNTAAVEANSAGGV